MEVREGARPVLPWSHLQQGVQNDAERCSEVLERGRGVPTEQISTQLTSGSYACLDELLHYARCLT